MNPRPVPRAVWVACAALALMVALAFVVTADNAVTRADADIVRWVADWRTPFIVDLGEIASLFGNILVTGPIAVLAGIVAGQRRGWTPMAALPALALAAAALSNPLAKLIIGRPRPPLELAEVIESSSGFPSGHSAQSAAIWIALALLIGARSAHPRRWLATGIAMTLVVGLSRIILGAHSPTDLIGGWALGLACVLLCREALGPRPAPGPSALADPPG